MTVKIKLKNSKLLIFISLLLAVSIWINLYYSIWSFDNRIVKPYDNFEFKNDLQCEVVLSSGKLEDEFKTFEVDYNTFELKDLFTLEPKIYYPDGISDNLTKAYDSDGYMELQNDSQFGISNTIGIMKDSGSMVRVQTGADMGTWKYHDAFAQKGRCK